MLKHIVAGCALLLGLATPAAAVDGEGLFYVRGAGSYTCARWLNAGPDERINAEHWWAGYLTAVNRFTPDTYDELGQTSVAAMNGILTRICSDDPSQLFAIAAHRAIEELHPNRTRKSPNR